MKQAVDTYDIASLMGFVDNNRAFIGNGSILALHRYGTDCGEERETGVTHQHNAQLSVLIGGRQQIGVTIYCTGIAAERLVSMHRFPLL